MIHLLAPLLLIIIFFSASMVVGNNQIIQLDIHPSISYIHWLHQQQDQIIDNDDNDNNREQTVPRTRGLQRNNRRRLIEEQLQQAMEHIQGTSAAYAPFFEFPMDIIDPSDDGDDEQRRLQQTLQRHINAVQTYNERHRQFSRYERALQQKRRKTTSSKYSISSLVDGDEWQASEILVSDTATNFSQLQPSLFNNPITLAFGAKMITGSTGCNQYFASYIVTSENSFNTSVVGYTRKTCALEGVMEQEQSYTSLLSNRHFLIEVVNASESSSGMDELTFWDNIIANDVSSKEEGAYGQVLARFIPRVNSSSNDQSKNLQIRSLQESTNTKKKGGMFNSYQTSPLHQGYGTHYATVWVGTPPQRKSVIIDTGSHFTAFPCKGCVNCGEEHHTDKYFDQDASSTFRALTRKASRDGPKECQGSVECIRGQCILSQTYTEGSSWEAFQAIDKLFVGGKQLTSALRTRSDPYGKAIY